MGSFPSRRAVAATAALPVILSAALAGVAGAQSPAAPDTSISGTVDVLERLRR